MIDDLISPFGLIIACSLQDPSVMMRKYDLDFDRGLFFFLYIFLIIIACFGFGPLMRWRDKKSNKNEKGHWL